MTVAAIMLTSKNAMAIPIAETLLLRLVSAEK